MRALSLILPLALLSGCATVTGRRQIITITTDPPGAACVVDQLGAAPGDHLDEVPQTPGTVLVDQSDKRLKITCALEGFPTTQALQGSGVNPYVAGNVLNGMVIGTAIDLSSGAFYRYPRTVNLNLRTVPPPAPAAAAGSAMRGAPLAAPRMAVAPTPLESPVTQVPAVPKADKPAPASNRSSSHI